VLYVFVTCLLYLNGLIEIDGEGDIAGSRGSDVGAQIERRAKCVTIAQDRMVQFSPMGIISISLKQEAITYSINSSISIHSSCETRPISADISTPSGDAGQMNAVPI